MRLLHFADVHLDRPFAGLSQEVARRRRRGLREAFDRLTAAAREHEVDLVTIGGDLWEDENVVADTRNSVAYQLKQLGVPVLLACGNHDPLLPGGNYHRTSWPSNVHLFAEDEPSEFKANGVSVWGVSWKGASLDPRFLERFRVPDDGRTHLLLIHGTARDATHAIGGEGYCPFEVQQVARAGFALCLAGHLHAATERQNLLYPGSPEPLGWRIAQGSLSAMGRASVRGDGSCPRRTWPNSRRGMGFRLPLRDIAGLRNRRELV